MDTAREPAAGSHGTEATGGDQPQERVTRAYDRIAWIYDPYTSPMEWTGLARRRRRMLAQASGEVLEVGAGTGRSFAFYPEGVHVTATDAAPKMIQRARRRADASRVPIDVTEADVRNLPFPDDTFETVVAACVFCSVADPVRGLHELGRVVKPDGTILLLEHVRPRNRLAGRIADAASVVSRRVMGVNLNRRTEENVAAAGLRATRVLREGIWREIVAGPPA